MFFYLKLGKVLVKKMNTMKIVKMMKDQMKDNWRSTLITASLSRIVLKAMENCQKLIWTLTKTIAEG